MKLIRLSSKKYPNLFAKVDDKNFEWLNRRTWYVHKEPTNFYAVTRNKGATISMHRLIMQVKTGEIIDHKDIDGLNNQENNLRKCTAKQNKMNCGKKNKKGGNTSKYKGVFFRKREKRWVAKIFVNNKSTELGYFKNEIDAAKAYNIAAKIHFKEFAYLNEL